MVLLVLPVEEGLLGEVVAAAEARLRIDARELRVGDRGEEREDQCEPDSRPDVARYGTAVRRRGRRLQLIGDPQKCARRDQRHRVHGDAGEPERRLHAACVLRHTPLLSPRVRGATDMPCGRRAGPSGGAGRVSRAPRALLVRWAMAQKKSSERTANQKRRPPVAISWTMPGVSGT